MQVLEAVELDVCHWSGYRLLSVAMGQVGLVYYRSIATRTMATGIDHFFAGRVDRRVFNKIKHKIRFRSERGT